MPFRSRAQQRFMFSQKPEMAKRWADHTSDIKSLPEHVDKDEKSASTHTEVPMSDIATLAAAAAEAPYLNKLASDSGLDVSHIRHLAAVCDMPPVAFVKNAYDDPRAFNELTKLAFGSKMDSLVGQLPPPPVSSPVSAATSAAPSALSRFASRIGPKGKIGAGIALAGGGLALGNHLLGGSGGGGGSPGAGAPVGDDGHLASVGQAKGDGLGQGQGPVQGPAAAAQPNLGGHTGMHPAVKALIAAGVLGGGIYGAKKLFGKKKEVAAADELAPMPRMKPDQAPMPREVGAGAGTIPIGRMSPVPDPNEISMPHVPGAGTIPKGRMPDLPSTPNGATGLIPPGRMSPGGGMSPGVKALIAAGVLGGGAYGLHKLLGKKKKEANDALGLALSPHNIAKATGSRQLGLAPVAPPELAPAPHKAPAKPVAPEPSVPLARSGLGGLADVGNAAVKGDLPRPSSRLAGMGGLGTAGLIGAGGLGLYGLHRLLARKKRKEVEASDNQGIRAIRRAVITKIASHRVKFARACMDAYLNEVVLHMPNLEKSASVRRLQAEIVSGKPLSKAIKVAYPHLHGEARGILAAQLCKAATTYVNKLANSSCGPMDTQGSMSMSGPIGDAPKMFDKMGMDKKALGMPGDPGRGIRIGGGLELGTFGGEKKPKAKKPAKKDKEAADAGSNERLGTQLGAGLGAAGGAGLAATRGTPAVQRLSNMGMRPGIGPRGLNSSFGGTAGRGRVGMVANLLRFGLPALGLGALGGGGGGFLGRQLDRTAPVAKALGGR